MTDWQAMNARALAALTPGCPITYRGRGGIGLPRGKQGRYIRCIDRERGSILVQMDDGEWAMPARLVEMTDEGTEAG